MPSEPLDDIKARIAAAAREQGRDPNGVRLIAVSKTFDSDAIRPWLSAGLRDFAENRVQEAEAKYPLLRAEFPDLRLHLVGPLQSNKAADAVSLFDVIHTVDRDKIAIALSKEMARQARNLRFYVQVNVGEEPQKAGVGPSETAAFVERCRSEHGLLIEGLMAIPPVDQPPGPFFALLAKLAKDSSVSRLSMGMSDDFETAVRFGSTDVRIGRALFGYRPKQN